MVSSRLCFCLLLRCFCIPSFSFSLCFCCFSYLSCLRFVVPILHHSFLHFRLVHLSTEESIGIAFICLDQLRALNCESPVPPRLHHSQVLLLIWMMLTVLISDQLRAFNVSSLPESTTNQVSRLQVYCRLQLCLNACLNVSSAPIVFGCTMRGKRFYSKQNMPKALVALKNTTERR